MCIKYKISNLQMNGVHTYVNHSARPKSNSELGVVDLAVVQETYLRPSRPLLDNINNFLRV